MTRYIVVSRPYPHLPHDSEELQSPPPPDALTDEIAQKNAELMIGRLLGKTAVAADAGMGALPPARASAPVTAPPARMRQEPAADPAPAPAAPAGPDATVGNTVQVAPPAQAAARKPPERTPRPDGGGTDPAEARLRAALLEGSTLGEDEDARDGFFARLRPVHGVALAIVLAVLLWPVFIGAVALLLIGIVTVVTLLLRRAVAGGRWRRFARRHPRTAERLRSVGDRAAVGIDRVLDLLPAGLADRLAWPDLSEPLSPGMG